MVYPDAAETSAREEGGFALSREQQLVKRPTGLTSMITNWLEGSVDQCRCKDRMIFEGVIFLQVILRHSAYLWQNYFKTSETILYIMLYFYVTIRACDSLYGVKLKAAIFICDIQAMLAFLLFQINAFGTVKEVVQSLEIGAFSIVRHFWHFPTPWPYWAATARNGVFRKVERA